MKPGAVALESLDLYLDGLDADQRLLPKTRHDHLVYAQTYVLAIRRATESAVHHFDGLGRTEKLGIRYAPVRAAVAEPHPAERCPRPGHAAALA